ncbi:hypothetical protein B0A55_13523 [Friedmanniomyces simplex]|uniref:PD-(D/E)XK nuclease-like domain-containing protein n=1 Tax=Friedmanniomyces simplex TaxID=329884 RepID=A0A4U0WMW8_9PEZI|nr:hypothetical protein B0A55_13523 [Friedmanniomyces simplex]
MARIGLYRTIAEISPRTLLPSYTNPYAAKSSRIDFAIALQPSGLLRQSFPYLEPVDNAMSRSWNVTAFAPITEMPLTVLIETKKKGADTQTAEYQVGIWALAHFTRIRHLLNGNGNQNVELLPLPLLVGDGGRWEWSIATPEAGGGIVSYTVVHYVL